MRRRLRKSFSERLITIWYADQRPHFFLRLLSSIYKRVMLIRGWLYRRQIFRATHFSIPVIIVGNLTVGGNGKTPLVAWLAEWLKREGFNPGIISRGYGGRSPIWPQAVTECSDPRLVGDEAVMLVQQTGCPMWVGPKRVQAVHSLLNQHACNVIISDDGLQHLALGRNIEVVLIDGMRGFGNGYCLPAGPLREPEERLMTTDFCVINTSEQSPTATAQSFSQKLKYKNLSASPVYSMQLKPLNLRRVMDPTQSLTLEQLIAQLGTSKIPDIHALAGIGNPERFFQLLTDLGLKFTQHIFLDHHFFNREDIALTPHGMVIMTEKDAIKCRSFADERHWFLPVTAVMDENFVRQFRKKIVTVHA